MEKRLTLREHLGYGIASMGDSITYVFVGSFLMFFLTTVAGISPASAGVISALGSVFSAVSNPIIGYASDQVYTKYGRRRPALLVFALPLGAVVTLLFTDVPLHGTAKVLYYGIFLLLFWFVYTGFFVPYNALGAAYTTNSDDRTRLRLFASMFNSFGNLISLGAPAALSAFLIARGFGQGPAWTSVGALIGVVAAASLLITFAASKEKDPPVSRPDRSQKEPFHLSSLFGEYLSVAKLPPVRWLILASVTSLIAYTLVTADIVYYLTYCLSFSASTVSLCLLLMTCFRMFLLLPQGQLSARLDKRPTIILFNLFAVCGFIVSRLIASASAPAVIFFTFLAADATGTYWAIMPSIYYDVCDYDKLQSGKERAGTIVSFQGLVESIAAGTGSLLLGFILQLAGFDGTAAVQSELALTWIHHCATLAPALMLVLSSIAIYKYPITRDVYHQIRQQLLMKD
jgi:GPH family glycoside/pentoside/hexuronide:cation symporter